MKRLIFLLTCTYLLVTNSFSQDQSKFKLESDALKYKLSTFIGASYRGNGLLNSFSTNYLFTPQKRLSFGANIGYSGDRIYMERYQIGPSLFYKIQDKEQTAFIQMDLKYERNQVVSNSYFLLNDSNSRIEGFNGASATFFIGYQFKKEDKNSGLCIKYGIDAIYGHDNSLVTDQQNHLDYSIYFDYYLMFGYSFYF